MAGVLLQAPEVVFKAHRDFVAAGAGIITANSYSCVASQLAKANLAEVYAELATLAEGLARKAADWSAETVAVAGSLPPLLGSYRVDLVLSDREARPVYASLAKALAP